MIVEAEERRCPKCGLIYLVVAGSSEPCPNGCDRNDDEWEGCHF